MLLLFDKFDDHDLAHRQVHGVDQALHEAHQDENRFVDGVRKRECRQPERLQHGQRLRPDEQLVAVDAVNPDSGEGREEKDRYLARETDQSQEKRL